MHSSALLLALAMALAMAAASRLSSSGTRSSAVNLKQRRFMKGAVRAPPFLHRRALADGTDPCRVISQAYEAFKASPNQKPPGQDAGPVILDVPPSVGVACFRSAPPDVKRTVALIDYLAPYVQEQTTLELLKNPPPEYMLPGVDVVGNMDAIKQKMQQGGYQSQYDAILDLHSVFTASYDNHFAYTPGLLSAFRFARPELDFLSLSPDGLQEPRIFAFRDIKGAPEGASNASVSPIVSIDGQPVAEFLQRGAMTVPSFYQDPDAQYNGLFSTVTSDAIGFGSALTDSILPVPDNHTITFQNGRTKVVQNFIGVPAANDLSGIRSVQDLRARFDIPPPNTGQPNGPGRQPDGPGQQPPKAQPKPRPTVPGYPVPVAKHPGDMLSGYLVNDTASGRCAAAAIAFLSFIPISDGFQLDDDAEGAFLNESRAVFTKTFQAAKAQGCDRLVIDMTSNPGGLLGLADLAYTELFPGGKFDAFDRFRATDNIEATVEIVPFQTVAQALIDPEGFPKDAEGKTLQNAASFVGPFNIQGQNVTAPFQTEKTNRIAVKPDLFLKGYGPAELGKQEPPFKPENIVVVTDGGCASACTIFTGLLVRNQGLRTLALGGRPMNRPMQAIGGVRGSEVKPFNDIQTRVQDLFQLSTQDRQARNILRDVSGTIPSPQDAPLLPSFQSEDAGSVNFRNAYAQNDVQGLPLHFKYEAANCKLYYTPQMVSDVTEVWRQAINVAWGNGTCVPGSTVNQDGTMGATTPAFIEDVRGRAPSVPLPLSVNPGETTTGGVNAPPVPSSGSVYPGGTPAQGGRGINAASV